MVELVRAGRSPEESAQEYESSAQTIRTWANQDRVDAGARWSGGRVRPVNGAAGISPDEPD
jgi:hypothetical protein